MITEYEIPVSAVSIWTVKVEEHQPGEFIAWCTETATEGIGTTEEDAVENFISCEWPPQTRPEPMLGPPVPVPPPEPPLARVYRFPLRGRMLERAITGVEGGR